MIMFCSLGGYGCSSEVEFTFLLHLVAFFHVASLFSTGVEKVAVKEL